MASFTFQSLPKRSQRSRPTASFLVFLLLSWVFSGLVRQSSAQLHDESFPEHPRDEENGKRLTREYRLKQGVLKGLVLEPRDGKGLDGVEVFLGIPYAGPPVGGMRFMPPGSATQWSGLKLATTFAPVCPQTLPDLKKESFMSAGRYNYLKRLMPFLKNQSEDCLYLNIYVPYSEGYSPYGNVKKYPVLIFIHGESFEWNSGNPYDGTVLAAYGQIIVVTINFRLGILGFMKPSISEHTIGNFGLLDQVAALQWVKDNIAAFHGDPNAVTLAGHGTGAACANFLMVSPVANGLFHRAILMSGSALSDWALTDNPLQFTVQAAQSLNCPLTTDDMGDCLRRKRLSDIMAVRVSAPKYKTSFGPIIDGSVIPNEPAQVMGVYKNLFSKYELMYGCTELESYHLLGAVALVHGMLESERDTLLRLYTQARFELRPDLALAATLKEYSTFDLEPGKSAADSHRDALLDILSDARVTAPLVQTANFHSKANPKSYFYVFGHNSQAGEYAALSKSVHGEELAYVFGIPLGATGNHFREEYSPQEKLFSEVIMSYWTNFARTGNPNNPRKNSFLSLGPKDWDKYDIDWPQYNPDTQSFIHLGIPPYISTRYRNRYMKYWNEILPNMLKNHTSTLDSPFVKYVKTTQRPYRFGGGPPSWINPTVPKAPVFTDYREPSPNNNDRYGRFNPFPRPPIEFKPPQDTYDAIRKMDRPNRPMAPGIMDGPLKTWRLPKQNMPPILVAATNTDDSITNKPTSESPVPKASLTLPLVISIGVAFLLINIFTFTFLYYKKSKLRALESQNKQINTCSNGDLPDGDIHCYEKGVDEVDTNNKKGCNVFRIIKDSNVKTKADDYYEPVKNNVCDGSKTPKSDDSGGFGQRFKLRRHMSNSTLDAHTKVRDWIAHEIVQRCSPRFLRKSEDPKPEPRHLMNSNLINIPFHGKNINEEISKDIPKPNCKIGSLTGSLKAPTDSTASAGALEKQNNASNDKNKNSSNSKKSSKHTGSGKSSKPGNSVSTKSTKSKHSNEKNASDGSLRKTHKPHKVSVAIDATPGTRSSSVLKQQPIEFSKSLDYCCYIDDSLEMPSTPLRRSQTVEDFVKRSSQESLAKADNVFKSTVNLKVSVPDFNNKPSEVIKITHKHSVSDPVKDVNYAEMFPHMHAPKQPGSFHTFSTIQPPAAFRNDINVTSREEANRKTPMTPEESLMNMKRRNYPKVLPDLPKTGDNVPTLAQKRLSLPPQNYLLLFPTSEESSVSNSEASTPTELRSFLRHPPLPPPRTSSTLGRKHSATVEVNPRDVINARKNISPHYVEMCSSTLPNSIRFSSNPSDLMHLYAQIKQKPKNRVNMQELEMSDVSQSDQSDIESEREDNFNFSPYEIIKPKPRVIVSTNPNEPVKVMDPKVIIRPVINRNPTPSRQTSIPRVVARDNSFDKADMKSFASNKPPPHSIKDALHDQKYDTVDSKMKNISRPTDFKINIPVYVPDTKGPPTPQEMERLKARQLSQERKIDDVNQTPQKNDPKIKNDSVELNIINVKSSPVAKEENSKINKTETKVVSMSRSNSNSKIPKTPTMVVKNPRKELKVQHSPKTKKSKNINKSNQNKTSAIPQPVQINHKPLNDSLDNDQSTSESSNDTECSTGTVKKVK